MMNNLLKEPLWHMFMVRFQHQKRRHFIACKSYWVTLASPTHHTLISPRLAPAFTTLAVFLQVWKGFSYQRVAQGHMNEEWQAVRMPPCVPLRVVACSRGWAEVWLGILAYLGKLWLLLPNCYGFTSIDPKHLCGMRAARVLPWEQCVMWGLPRVVCTTLLKGSGLLGVCALQQCREGWLCSSLVLSPRAC